MPNVTFGSKYDTKIVKYPTPRDIDYDAALKVTRPKSPAVLIGEPKPSMQNNYSQSMFNSPPSKK
jgi:hypothetical protein